MNRIFIFVFLLLEIWSLSLWKECTRFADMFYFSPLDLSLRLNESIQNDTGLSLQVIRLFHNKLLGSFIDILTNWLLFFSPVFLIHLLSFAGFVGLLIGIWYLWGRKDKRLPIMITFVMGILPLIEIISKPHIPFFLRLPLLTLPLFGISLYGLSKLIDGPVSRKKIVILLLFLILSIWWVLILGKETIMFCIVS